MLALVQAGNTEKEQTLKQCISNCCIWSLWSYRDVTHSSRRKM